MVPVAVTFITAAFNLVPNHGSGRRADTRTNERAFFITGQRANTGTGRCAA